MLYIKYLSLLVVLFALHYLLGSAWLIASWCLLGIISAVWLREARFPLLNILILEMCIGILFRVFFWGSHDQLSVLSHNAGIDTNIWLLAAVFVNVITALLCAGTFFYFTRLIRNRKKSIINPRL